MSIKLSNKAKQFVESYGCRMLEQYVNLNEKILMQCKCGNKMFKSLKNFKESKHKSCDDCAKKIKFDKLRNDPKEVKKYIESFGCELLDIYENANKPISIKCSCGNITKRTFANFKECENKTCSKCSHIKGSKKRAPSFESVKSFIENAGCRLLSMEYKNANTPMSLQCKCGEKWKTNYHTFKRSKHKACKICSAAEGAKKISGKNSNFYGKTGKLNHNYKKNNVKKIFAKRFASQEYRVIRQKVLLRDNCTCKKCGFVAKFKGEKNSLNVHHLFSKAKYPKWFFKMLNLITLCAECHVNFHKAFGFVDNKPKQMKIYLKGNN